MQFRKILTICFVVGTYSQFRGMVYAEEPPLVCEFSRGTWCLLAGPEEIKMSRISNKAFYHWELSQKFWKSEIAHIIEPKSCRSNVADQVTLLRFDKDFSLEGEVMNRLIVRLSGNTQCDLQLIYPKKVVSKLGIAKSVLLTTIAACFKGVSCEENILAKYINGNNLELR